VKSPTGTNASNDPSLPQREQLQDTTSPISADTS
jgi:hypothetical protein